MKEAEFVDGVRAAGGRVFIAGGWVRDFFRGAVAKDKDYVLAGLSEAIFNRLFPDARKVGKAFPVYVMKLDGKLAEIAFCRTERKSGAGYRGFAVSYDPSVTIEEDLKRRDTTMNSMAMELPTGEVLDPFDGRGDIVKKKIRATSEHFCEDPVRALRAARQAAELGFSIEQETLRKMEACKAEIKDEPQERLFQEMERALQTKQPSVFFRMLEQATLLEATFPEIFALIGQSQPLSYHPEGDAFQHSLQVLDRAASFDERPLVRFAALVHDIGKGCTKKELLPHHYEHEKVGVRVLWQWKARMNFPAKWLQAAEFAISQHMRAPGLKKAGKVMDFLLAAEKNPLGLPGICAIIEADHKSLPLYLAGYAARLDVIHRVSTDSCPADYRGKAIGEWLRNARLNAYIKAFGNLS